MKDWPSIERGDSVTADKPAQTTARVVAVRDGADKRVITFRASTFGVDRHKTRIKPEGIDTVNYDKNPVFLWGHDGYGGFFSVPQMDHVLGRVIGFKRGPDAFDIDVDFAPEDVNPKAEMAYRMVRAGFLNAVSVGFIPKEIVRDMEDEKDIPIITKSELLEVSLVPIPSNPDALALSRSMMDFDVRSTRAKMGWVCQHGQFYSEPGQADSCAGHEHEPPATAADHGAVRLVSRAINDQIDAIRAESAVRRAVKEFTGR